MKIKLSAFILMLFTCITVFSQSITIDEALERAGKTIANDLETGTLVAIVSFPGLSKQLADYAIDGLLASMVDAGHLRVLSRYRVDQVFAEFGLKVSSPVSDTAALMIGSLLGVQVIVTGSITRFGEGYRLLVQSMDISTSIIRTFSITAVMGNVRLPQMPRTPVAGEPGYYLPDNFSLAMLGYSFTPDTPIGFTAGFANFYTSWGFNLPNWLGHDRNQQYSTESSRRQVVNDYLALVPTENNTKERQIIDGVLGYNINIIPGFLYVPIGFGVRIAKDWTLFNNVRYEEGTEEVNGTDETFFFEVDPPYVQEWYAQHPGWYVSPLVELGVMASWRFMYLAATYAVVIPTGNHHKTVDHRFSIGLGLNQDMSTATSSRPGGLIRY